MSATTRARGSALAGLALSLMILGTAGCASRAPYVRPTADVAAAFKENANWKPAQPQDAITRGDWWEIFGDPQLTALERQVTVSNQTLKAVEAQFAEAVALVHGARSNLYPQVTASPSITNARPSGDRAVSSFHNDYNDFLLPVGASYEIDAWGRIHGIVESARTNAQASAADLETARLSVHSELAVDYFALRGLDRDQEILNAAVTAYQRAFELTTNRFQGGIASQVDVALAETQLESTRAEAIDVQAERAVLEHAIAVLTGQPASTFSIAASPLMAVPPDVPAGVPSNLLERRPDIAAAERRVASANAEVGVATAAFYPILTLSGSTGFESSSFGSWLAVASHFWTVGPAALVTVFDAGRRHAVADQARAEYDQASATYRESVLSAFRDVEDQLATLRVLEQEATVEDRAVAAAERSLALANNRYTGGVSTYLEVITAQNAALTNERVANSLLIRRMDASVLLLKGLGGGWNQASLPQVIASTSSSTSAPEPTRQP